MRIVLYSKDLRHMADLSFGLQQQEHAATVVSATELTLVSASRIAQTFRPDCALIVLPGAIDPRQYALAFQNIGHFFGGLTLLCHEALGLATPRLVRVEGEAQAMYWFEAAAEQLLNAHWLGGALRIAGMMRFVGEQGPFNIPQPKRRVTRRTSLDTAAVPVPPLKTGKQDRRSNRCLSIPTRHITLELLPEQLPILAWFIAHVGREFTAAEIAEELEGRNAVRRSPSTVNSSIIRLRNKLRVASGSDLIQINTAKARFFFVDHDEWAACLRIALEKIEFCRPIFAPEKKPARKKAKEALVDRVR